MFASIISMEGVSRRSRLRVVVYAVNLRRMQRTYVSRTQSAPFRHGGIAWAPRVRLSVSHRTQNALFRDVAAPGRCRTTPPPGCGALWETAQLGKRARATPRQPAGRLAPGSADLGSESGLTERRTLQPAPHGKPHSAIPRSRRLRLSVTRRLQNAPFRHVAAAECVFP